MHFVIFAGGDFHPGVLSTKAIKAADKIIAADSGAKTAVDLNVFPTTVVGDFDSLDTKTKVFLEKKGSRPIISSPEKDETDIHLAINYAISQGADRITILGGTTGDRFDHILSSLFIGAQSAVPIIFVDGRQKSWIENGPQEIKIEGTKDDLLSLIPISSSVTHIKTQNLHYPLKDESLFLGKTRGVSNVFLKPNVEVSFSTGILLFVHTHI